MKEWSQKICNIAVPPQTVGEQNLLHHCLSSKPVGLLHFTPYGRLIFDLKSPKAIRYQQLREDRVACWWETTKHSSSWENSVFCEASSLQKLKRQWFTLGSQQPISSRRGGTRATPPCPTLLLRAAGRACGGRDRNSWVQLQQKLQDTKVRISTSVLRQSTGTAGQTTATKVTSGSHQKPALMEKPVERLDETETKARSCTKSCIRVSLEW